uniref:Uncharacterized protein n=2 Tax=Kalmanozyma brasiliensis (strain GHG001) TaxID=1365824 RepID=V5EZ45_KALBG
MGGAPVHVSGPGPVEKPGVAEDGQGDESIATSRSISSRNGWNQVPIQAVAPSSQPDHAAYSVAQNGQQQQTQPPSIARVASHGTHQPPQQQPTKADTSYLPLFPVAPHADNGFGAQRNSAEGASPVASPYTNAPSSAGMWQSTAGKSPAEANAAATESPLIEF